jgi:hypothetical protein
MPYLASLAAQVAAMRSGHGRRRAELRRLLATIDPQLRHARNFEHVKLSGIRARLRNLDTRLDPGALQAAVEASAQRLAVLDQRIVEAIARQLRPRSS